jgi:hypothetical protein
MIVVTVFPHEIDNFLPKIVTSHVTKTPNTFIGPQLSPNAKELVKSRSLKPEFKSKFKLLTKVNQTKDPKETSKSSITLCHGNNFKCN